MHCRIISDISRRLKSNFFGLSIAIIVSSLFFIIYSYFSVMRYLSMNATAWDLGVHTQALWGFLSGKSFYSMLLGQNLLSIHFQPFIFILVPLYYVFPTPVSLLVFQSFFLAFSSVILYDLSMRILTKKFQDIRFTVVVSLVISLSYLTSPLTFGSVMFDFHFMAFLPFFYLLAIDSFVAGKKLMHVLSLAFIISLHSNFVYIVASMLVFDLLLITEKNRGFLYWTLKHSARHYVSLLFLSIVILYLYVVFSGIAKGILIDGFSKGFVIGIYHVGLLPETGQIGSAASTPAGLLLSLIRSPAHVWSFITSNYTAKIYYFLIAIGTTGIISILYVPALIPLLPFLSLSVFSNYQEYYILGYQYSAMIEPILYAALPFAIVLLANKLARTEKIRIRKLLRKYEKITLTILCISVVLSIPLSPISPQNIYVGDTFGHLYDVQTYRPTPATDFVFQVRNHIPSNAYILTQNNLMPFFSRFNNVDSTPYSYTVESNLNNFSYLIIETSNNWSTYSSVGFDLARYANTYLQNGWSVMAEYGEYSILVLQRSSTDENKMFIPLNGTFHFHLIKSCKEDNNYTLQGYVSTTSLLPGSYLITLNGSSNGDFYFNSTDITVRGDVNTTNSSSIIIRVFKVYNSRDISFQFYSKYIIYNFFVYMNITSRSTMSSINSVKVQQESM